MSEETKKTEEKTVADNAAPVQEETKEQEQAAPVKEEKKEEAPKVEEKKEEAPKEEKGEITVKLSATMKKIIDDVEKMSVLELNDLVKAIEERFGVSAAAVAAGPAAGEIDAGEEQSEFAVVLSQVGEQKIAVMKAVKEVLGLGLKDAKELVDGAPATLKEGLKKEEAEAMKKQLEEAGATVELK